MKRLLLLFCLLAVFNPGLAAQDISVSTVPGSGEVVAFVGVNVVPMDAERVLPNQTVLVRNGRIEAMGPAASLQVPQGARRVEGNGRYLLPGLAEMHGHIPPPTDPPEFIENVLFLYVANGITTVRGMLGHEGQLTLRDRINRGELVGPTLYLAGPSFSGGSINSPEQAAAQVRAQKQAGWDLLKVHPGLTRDEYDAMARTAREVGIRFAGHVPADVGLLHALDAGQETFDHLDGYIEHLQGDRRELSEADFAEVVRRTKEAGAWVIPTMVLWETLHGIPDLETVMAFPELRYMPPNVVQQWRRSHEGRLSSPDRDAAAARRLIDNRMRLLKALNDGGVKILFGTDAPQQFSVPGFSVHRELQRMQEAGMTPYEILRSGTYNVGEYFKNWDRFGTVEVGKRADLILVPGNPLEDLSVLERPAGVMVRGRWLPAAEIQSRLDRIAASYRN